MSVVITYVGLQLRLAELFSEVADQGFVMPADRAAIHDNFVATMRNAIAFWEEQLPCGSMSLFDAETLAHNPHVRHDLALTYIHCQMLDAQEVRPEDAQINTTLATIEAGNDDVSESLLELANDDDFANVLGMADIDLARKLDAYATARGGERGAAAAAPQRIPELDIEAAEYSEMLRIRLCTLIRLGNLPQPLL